MNPFHVEPHFFINTIRLSSSGHDVLYEAQTVTICFHSGRVFSVMNRRNRKMIGNIFKFVGKWKSSKQKQRTAQNSILLLRSIWSPVRQTGRFMPYLGYCRKIQVRYCVPGAPSPATTHLTISLAHLKNAGKKSLFFMLRRVNSHD